MTQQESGSHEARVAAIQAQVRARPDGKRLTIQKARAGHSPHGFHYKAGRHPVDVGALDHILTIDEAGLTATVEGEVTIGALCQATMAYGLMPQVVPEFETFTVAGLINGFGIETSSHRFGVFPATIASFDLVLGDGERVTVSPTEHRDLYLTVPGSYGTLGVVTRATVGLVRVQPFISARYRRYEDVDAYVAAFTQAIGPGSGEDFVEGFAMAAQEFVLCTGRFAAEDPDLPTYQATTYGERWYFQHVRRMAGQAAERGQEAAVDQVPTYAYMFRHQRSLGWIAGLIADLSWFSNTRRGRAFLDKRVEKTIKARGFRPNMPVDQLERCLVHQDLVFRLSRMGEGIRWVQEHLGVYPQWHCPALMTDAPFLFAINRQELPDGLTLSDIEADPTAAAGLERLAVDIGVYGEPSVRRFRHIDAVGVAQRFVDLPTLWGVCYLSEDEIHAVYDLERYEAIKRRYRADGVFVDLLEKVRFADPGAKQGKIPLWRLVNLWWDTKAKFRRKG